MQPLGRGSVLSAERLSRLALELVEVERNDKRSLNLVPSENSMSPLAKRMLCSDYYHRYFFNQQGDPEFWEFCGGEAVAAIETELGLGALSRLSRANHVNCRPVSGMSAMLLVLLGLGGARSEAIISVETSTGGHYATPSLVRRLGYESVQVPVKNGAFCEERLRDALTEHKTSLIYFDLAHSLHPPNVRSAAEVMRSAGCEGLLHVDVSHVLGLVLGGAIPNPLDEGADCFGGSTHKTFPGPQKGVLFTRRDHVAKRLETVQIELISSHHFAETLALAFAAAEFETFGPPYARAVLSNAQTLADALESRQFLVHRAGTQATFTHQVWVDVESDKVKSVELSRRLAEVGVRINFQTGMPGGAGRFLRLGSNEMTFLGAQQRSMELVADCFAACRDGDSGNARARVAECRESFGDPFHVRDPFS